MPNLTTSSAVDTFMGSASNAAALANLGAVPLTGGTLTGALINSTNGAASTPVVSLTGTTFTGGSATTTKPTLLVEPTGTTSTGWNTAGTLIGVNAATAFAGDLLAAQVAGVSVMSLTRNAITGNDASNWRLLFGANVSIGWAAAWGALTVRNAANSADLGIAVSNVQATSAVNALSYVSAGARGSESDVTLSSTSWRGAGLRIRNTGTVTWTTGADTTSAAAAIIDIGTGSPESVVTAPVGSLYLRTDGGVLSTLYVKESGTSNTGWAAK